MQLLDNARRHVDGQAGLVAAHSMGMPLKEGVSVSQHWLLHCNGKEAQASICTNGSREAGGHNILTLQHGSEVTAATYKHACLPAG
jgi:hypothetical protein